MSTNVGEGQVQVWEAMGGEAHRRHAIKEFAYGRGLGSVVHAALATRSPKTLCSALFLSNSSEAMPSIDERDIGASCPQCGVIYSDPSASDEDHLTSLPGVYNVLAAHAPLSQEVVASFCHSIMNRISRVNEGIQLTGLEHVSRYGPPHYATTCILAYIQRQFQYTSPITDKLAPVLFQALAATVTSADGWAHLTAVLRQTVSTGRKSNTISAMMFGHMAATNADALDAAVTAMSSPFAGIATFGVTALTHALPLLSRESGHLTRIAQCAERAIPIHIPLNKDQRHQVLVILNDAGIVPDVVRLIAEFAFDPSATKALMFRVQDVHERAMHALEVLQEATPAADGEAIE